jgi:hypothetical protein
LLEALLTELKNQYRTSKEKVKECQTAHSELKKKLSDLKAERGKPEASIVAEVELYLETLKITRASYHGGDYNGVCCRRLVGNSKIISDEVRKILITKKNELCEDTTIDKKMDEVEQLLGLLDAAFAYLNTFYPNDLEKQKAREAVAALSSYWRKLGLSITLKAHVMEQHACHFNDLFGTGDKEESFIEQGHQIGAKDNHRYGRLTNFVKKTESTLSARLQSRHPLVQQQRLKVLHGAKRKKTDTGPTVKQRKKEEKKIKRDGYINNSKNEN